MHPNEHVVFTGGGEGCSARREIGLLAHEKRAVVRFCDETPNSQRENQRRADTPRRLDRCSLPLEFESSPLSALNTQKKKDQR
jgi:hypothetical protein